MSIDNQGPHLVMWILESIRVVYRNVLPVWFGTNVYLMRSDISVQLSLH